MPTTLDDTPPTSQALTEASNIAVWDENGQQSSFGDLFKPTHPGGKIIMIFIRHYHCGMCQDYVAALTKAITPAQLEAANTKLIIVGCGSWTLAKPYRELLECPFPIYSSPGKEAYVVLGMTLRNLDRGKTSPSYVSRSLFGGIMGSVTNAFKMGKVANAGDIKQLGGEFVFGEGPKFLFTHRMKNTRDHTEIKELMVAAGIAEAKAPTITTTTTAPPAQPAPTPSAVAAPVPEASNPINPASAAVEPSQATTETEPATAVAEPTATSTAAAPAPATT